MIQSNKLKNLTNKFPDTKNETQTIKLTQNCLENLCNGETCFFINNQIKCVCPSVKTGTYCEFDIRAILKSINYTSIL